VRPVVETGWENTVLIRILAEGGVTQMKTGSGEPMQMPGVVPAYGFKPNEDTGLARGPSRKNFIDLLTDSILKDWSSLLDEKVKEWNLDKDEMIKEFGEVRDRWIAKEQTKWLALNEPYGVVPDCMDAMQEAGVEVFIITTKQRRFCQALLDDWGLELKPGHLFALEDGPKVGVLRDLLQRPELAGRQFHFIEDKLGTLRRVSDVPELTSIQLHLADWGYNTSRDRKIVGAGVVDGVSLLTAGAFEELGSDKNWLE